MTAACPTRNPEIWVRRTEGETAAFNRSSGDVYLMNDTALAIWDLCDGQTRPDEMIDAIVDLCGMHPDIVTEDVGRILNDFDAAGLVTWTRAPLPH